MVSFKRLLLIQMHGFYNLGNNVKALNETNFYISIMASKQQIEIVE